MTPAPWPAVVLAGILGLAIGSFLNVVIHRVPRGESVVNPPSHCPSCDTALKGRHNVPVASWLALRGRCAFCRAGISVRYPLVEAVTGLLFAGLTLRFGLTPQLPAFLYLAAVAVALGMIDLDVRRLPDSIVLPSYVVAAALLMPAGAASGDWDGARRAATGMLVLTVLLFTVAIAFPNGLGFGDVKLAGLLGLYLAWLSWQALFVGVVATFVIAGVGGRTAVALRRLDRAAVFPLGPSLVSASVLAIFLAVPVTAWYASLLTV